MWPKIASNLFIWLWLYTTNQREPSWAGISHSNASWSQAGGWMKWASELGRLWEQREQGLGCVQRWLQGLEAADSCRKDVQAQCGQIWFSFLGENRNMDFVGVIPCCCCCLFFHFFLVGFGDSFFFSPNFKLFFLYWNITDEECCGSFRWKEKGLSHTNTCTHSPPSPAPIQAGTYHWVEFHVLYSRSLLAIYFEYSSVYMTFLNSLIIPSPDNPKFAFLFLFAF